MVSLVSVVSFRSFRFVVSGFSTCLLNDLQDVTAVTHDLFARFVSKIMAQKQLVVWLFPGCFKTKY